MIKLTQKKVFFAAFMLILFVSFSGFIGPVYSQTKFNSTYMANIGDSMTYEYTIVQVPKSFQPGGIVTLANNTGISYNITKGLEFTVKVDHKNSPNNISIDELYNIPNKGILVSKPIIPKTFIIPAFDNSSMVSDYINYQNLFSNSTNFIYSTYNSYTISGDYLSKTINTTENLCSPPGCTPAFYLNDSAILKWNWKTGWLDQSDEKVILPNDTILTWLQFQQIKFTSGGSSFLNIDPSLIIIGAGILAIPVTVIVVFVGFKMKKK